MFRLPMGLLYHPAYAVDYKACTKDGRLNKGQQWLWYRCFLMDLMVLGEQALHMGSVIGPQSRQGQQTSGCDIKLLSNEKRIRRDANTARWL